MPRAILRFVLQYQHAVDGITHATAVMPVGAKIARAGFRPHDGESSLWALAPMPAGADAQSICRFFLIAPTGATVPDEAIYLGTDSIGSLVWHFFEVEHA